MNTYHLQSVGDISDLQLKAHQYVEMLNRREDVPVIRQFHKFKQNCEYITEEYSISHGFKRSEWIPESNISLSQFYGNELFSKKIAIQFIKWVESDQEYMKIVNRQDSIYGSELFPDNRLMIDSEFEGTWWLIKDGDNILVPVNITPAVKDEACEFGDILYALGAFKQTVSNERRKYI